MKAKYEVGSCVIVKPLKQMIEEYGFAGDNLSIKCPFQFTTAMQDFCGKKLRITGLEFYSDINAYRYIVESVDPANLRPGIFHWSEQMFNPVQQDWDE